MAGCRAASAHCSSFSTSLHLTEGHHRHQLLSGQHGSPAGVQAPQSTTRPACLPLAVDAELRVLAKKKAVAMGGAGSSGNIKEAVTWTSAVAVPAVSDGFAAALVSSVVSLSVVSGDRAHQGDMSSGAKGLWSRIGHSHDERRRNHFVRIMQVGYAVCVPIPDGATSLLEGTNLPIPKFINLEPSTGCSWQLALQREDGMLVLASPWFVFVKFHGLVAGCVDEFEVVHPNLMKVNIYDKTCIKMRYKAFRKVLRVLLLGAPLSCLANLGALLSCLANPGAPLSHF